MGHKWMDGLTLIKSAVEEYHVNKNMEGGAIG